MEKDLLDLEEAARLLGKSVQTLRRMIKRGELRAEKLRTPQGFQYFLRRDQLFSNSPIQKSPLAQAVEKKIPAPSQVVDLTSQTEKEALLDNDYYLIDKSGREEVLLKKMERYHREKLFLLYLVGVLQNQIKEKKPPEGLLKRFLKWLVD